MLLYTAFEIVAFALVIPHFIMVFARRNEVRALKSALALVALLLAGSILVMYQSASYHVLAAFIVGMFIFNSMVSSYGSKSNFLYLVLAVLYIALFLWIGTRIIAEAILFGMLNEIAIMEVVKERHMNNKKVEFNRDIVQIIGGVILMAAFLFLGMTTADVFLFSIIIAGVFLVNTAKIYPSSSLSRVVYSLERRNTSLGLGALWLALGSLVAVSVLGRWYIIVVFAAIFIGDSAATLFGMKYRTTPLPWNKGKSVGGTAVYAAATLLISYPILGTYSILVAAVAALVESAPWGFDDNFTVSIVLAVMLISIRLYAGIL